MGKVAFDNCIKLYKQKFDIRQKFIFKHGKSQLLPDGIIILSSYHPSPRNVNTKLISNKMMVDLFKKQKNLLSFNSITKIRFKFRIYFIWNFYRFSLFIHKN